MDRETSKETRNEKVPAAEHDRRPRRHRCRAGREAAAPGSPRPPVRTRLTVRPAPTDRAACSAHKRGYNAAARSSRRRSRRCTGQTATTGRSGADVTRQITVPRPATRRSRSPTPGCVFHHGVDATAPAPASRVGLHGRITELPKRLPDDRVHADDHRPQRRHPRGQASQAAFTRGRPPVGDAGPAPGRAGAVAAPPAPGGGRRHRRRYRESDDAHPALRASPERTFESLYRHHAAEVYRYALVMLDSPADAEDVTQTMFLNAYQALSARERPRAAGSWLRRSPTTCACSISARARGDRGRSNSRMSRRPSRTRMRLG